MSGQATFVNGKFLKVTQETLYSLIVSITYIKTGYSVLNEGVYKGIFRQLLQPDVVAARHEANLGFQKLRDIFACEIKFL